MISIIAASIMLHAPLPEYKATCLKSLSHQIRKMALTEYRKFPRKRAKTLARAAIHAGRKFNIDPMLLLSISWWESRWNAKAKGDMRKGKPTSYGAFQMKKQALKSTGLGWKQKRLLNVYRAFWAGAAFLARLRSKYPGHELPVYGRGMAGLKMDNTRGGRWKLKRAKKLRREHKCKYGTRKRR